MTNETRQILLADLSYTTKLIAEARREMRRNNDYMVAGYLFLVAARKNIERMLAD